MRDLITGGSKRLFFGLEVDAPWPAAFPAGRLLDAAHRHLTLAFLGDIPYAPLHRALEGVPLPPYQIGLCGWFDRCLLLPPRRPSVVAWHAQWFDGVLKLQGYQAILSAWLRELGYSLDERPWLPHVTIGRSPFNNASWLAAFSPLPFSSGTLHLYESVGHLTYLPLWSHPIRRPFVEVDHTADIAFEVCGDGLEQLYHNAFCALAFKCATLLHYGPQRQSPRSLEELVVALNTAIALADGEVGCPLKAVSYHGEIEEDEQGILRWEMIVDV